MGRAKSYKPPTIEELQAEANKYQTRSEFSLNHQRYYQYARQNRLLDQICAHMPDLRKKWTIEELQAEALKYETRSAFQFGSNKAYQVARYHGVLDDICGHMK